jgi:hypothetical protein
MPLHYGSIEWTRLFLVGLFTMEVLNGLAFFLLAPNVAEFGRDQLGFVQSTSIIISIVFSGKFVKEFSNEMARATVLTSCVETHAGIL